MGWNSWNQYLCNINETLILAQAKAMVDNGLHEVGYEYINIDDCWQGWERDLNGRLQSNSTRFPSGIKSLAQRIHALGLKLGIYTDVGTHTCQGFPGSFGHFDVDAKTFAEWGIDFVKVDTCSLVDREKTDIRPFYANFSRELVRASTDSGGRPIVMSVCDWGRQNAPEWASTFAYQWRISMDIYPWYHRMLAILDDMAPLAKYASCGHFNDPDMLEVGITNHMFNHKAFPLVNLTLRESQTHFSLWSILASPLILGLDLRTIQKRFLNIVGNKDVIFINQDPLCIQASRIWEDKSSIFCTINCKSIEVWEKPLANGELAVLIFNRADSLDQLSDRFKKKEKIIVDKTILNITSNFDATNLWTQEKIVNVTNITVKLAQHASVIFRIQLR